MSKEVKTKATELRQVLGKTTQDQPGVELLLGVKQPRKTRKWPHRTPVSSCKKVKIKIKQKQKRLWKDQGLRRGVWP